MPLDRQMLRVNIVQLSDVGKYICMANNNVGHAMASAYIDVVVVGWFVFREYVDEEVKKSSKKRIVF